MSPDLLRAFDIEIPSTSSGQGQLHVFNDVADFRTRENVFWVDIVPCDFQLRHECLHFLVTSDKTFFDQRESLQTSKEGMKAVHGLSVLTQPGILPYLTSALSQILAIFKKCSSFLPYYALLALNFDTPGPKSTVEKKKS